MSPGYALRAPWYVRERGDFDLRDARALRPVIQMYDGTDFVDRLRRDPGDPLKFGVDDLWSYPVPVAFPAPGTGRERFATSTLLHTDMRKLYQPSHSRFYAVVVEVFCDAPGLPRAGAHNDLEVAFVVRRQQTVVSAAKRVVRRLARDLTVAYTKAQHPGLRVGALHSDVEDVLWADLSMRREFAAAHADLLASVEATTSEQAWVQGPAGGEWQTVVAPQRDDVPPDMEVLPMWRLPPRAADCAAARTRSLWFGLVPTYSAEVAADGAAKWDEHGVYAIRCFVREPLARVGCPAKVSWSEPTAPYRLAAPYDPDGTKNHRVTITMPDLRTLAARAGKPPGAGGVRVVTPPGSALLFKSDNGTATSPSVGGAGSVCTFALELFFIVAMFLFSLFLPVVVILFQLWWMLALRFCFPPSGSFGLLATFFADGHTLAELPGFPAERAALDDVVGFVGAGAKLNAVPAFAVDASLARDLVAAAAPPAEVPTAEPHELEKPPDDPLCIVDRLP